MSLSACIMVKDEKDQIGRTIVGCLDAIDCLVILDTGSTDGTPEVIKRICNQHKVPHFIYHQPFVDFSVSRNHLLKCARRHADYLLLLDANEELRGGDRLKRYLERNPDSDAFLMHFVCESKTTQQNFNRVAILRSKTPIYYRYPVHEELILDNRKIKDLSETGIMIYQNIHLDKSSEGRFQRDAELLQKELEKDPKNIHVLFFLGQTHKTLKQYEKSLECFERYLENKPAGEYKDHQDDLLLVYLSTIELLLFLKGQNWRNNIVHRIHECIKYVHGERMEPFYYLALFSYFLGEELERNGDGKCVNYYRKTRECLQIASKIGRPTSPTAVYSEGLYLEVPKKLKEIEKRIKILKGRL